MRYLLAVLSFAFLAACGGDGPTEPPPPSVTGTWQGSTSTFTMRLVLSATGSAVSGNGTITSPNLSTAMAATGTYAAPTVSLNLTMQGYEPMNFTGTVGATQMTGTLNGSGFNNVAITMIRQ